MNSSFDQKYLAGILLFLTSIFALVLALWISEANYLILAVAIIGALGAVYFFSLSEYWLVFSFVYAAFNLQMFPLGVGIRPHDVLLGLALVFVLSKFWKITHIKRSSLLADFRAFDFALMLFLGYLAFHLVINNRAPIRGDVVPTGTAIKTYILMAGGFVVCWIAVHFASVTRFGKNPTIIATAILAIALLFNIVVRVYGVIFLNLGEAEVGTQEVTDTVIMIPLVYLMENQHTLRFLGPVCCVVGAMILTSKCEQHRKLLPRLLSLFLLVFGLFGSLVSMGRASVFFAVVMITLVMFTRRLYVVFILAPVAAVILLIGIKIAYDYNPSYVPFSVQRAVAIVPFMDMDVASRNIEGSTLWRRELALRAWEEWKTSPRIQLIGRSTLALVSTDYNSLVSDPYWGGVRLALRKGTTHNLITDLLILTGGVGFVLYLVVYGTLLLGLNKIRKKSAKTTSTYDWCMICLIYFSMSLIYAVVGGAWFETWQTAFFGLTIWMATTSTSAAQVSAVSDEAWTE